MKSLRVILCLLAVGALMTACQKEGIDNSGETHTVKAFDSEDYLNNYNKQFNGKETIVEYVTLEESNAILIENGLEAVTLEQLGLTESEYQAAQERIKNNTAGSRCSLSTVLAMGNINSSYDSNGNPTTTTFDLVLATIALNGGAPFSIEEQAFGEISVEVANIYPAFTEMDINMLHSVLLGVPIGCN